MDNDLKRTKIRGTVKSSSGKAHESDGMRRTYLYAAMTEDEVERRRWAFDEAVKVHCA